MDRPTEEEVKKEPAGPRIDALFAELVMGWKKKTPHGQQIQSTLSGWFDEVKQKYIYCYEDFTPSTNLNHAFEGVGLLIERFPEDFRFSLVYTPFTREWIAQAGRPWVFCHGEKTEKALVTTRALILWVLGKEG